MLMLPDRLQSAMQELAWAYGKGNEDLLHEKAGAVLKAAFDANVPGLMQPLMDGAREQGYRVKAVLS